MNIAICDRYDTDITRISEFLDANIKNHMLNHALLEVDTFTSTDELLASPKEYSLIFLGILMPGTDGIEAARQLKDGPNPPIIIFTTKSTEHCLASYNLGVEGNIGSKSLYQTFASDIPFNPYTQCIFQPAFISHPGF